MELLTETIPDGFYRTSIKALILDEKKRFLLFLEENGLWELPGGGLHFGEQPHDCLVRELKEEAGLEVLSVQRQPSYFVVGTTRKGLYKTDIIYEVTIKDLAFQSSEECVDVRFFTKEEALQEKLYSTVREFVKTFTPESHK
jgi:8-oxo-dGTP pyrophosphatase MutT (NUDIX family)